MSIHLPTVLSIPRQVPCSLNFRVIEADVFTMSDVDQFMVGVSPTADFSPVGIISSTGERQHFRFQLVFLTFSSAVIEIPEVRVSRYPIL